MSAPVIGSSIAPIVEHFEGSEASVCVPFEAQRSMPQVVPAALIQEDHLQGAQVTSSAVLSPESDRHHIWPHPPE